MLKIDRTEMFSFSRKLLLLSAIAIFFYKIGGIALGLQPALDRETVLSGLMWFPIIYAGTVAIVSLVNGWIALQARVDR